VCATALTVAEGVRGVNLVGDGLRDALDPRLK
jgi:ABC-type dipeptide/oligopeptide/nickel transport system permease subunit